MRPAHAQVFAESSKQPNGQMQHYGLAKAVLECILHIFMVRTLACLKHALNIESWTRTCIFYNCVVHHVVFHHKKRCMRGIMTCA